MAGTNRERAKELAQLLYTRNNFTQKEVAKKVGVSEVTMSKWVNTENWDALKTTITATREEQLRRLYLQLAEYNTAIETRERGKRYPSSKEADAMNKIASAIEKLERETGAVEILNVSTKFLRWLGQMNLDEAKRISGYFDAFIKDSIR